jgi:hypothetical protein
MKREVVWFYVTLLAGTVAYFGFSFPSFMGLMAYLVFLMAVRAAMVRYQWVPDPAV